MLVVADRTDDELAAEEVGGEDLAVIPAEHWRDLVRVPGLLVYVLDQAERGGIDTVNAALTRYGIGLTAPPGPPKSLG